LKAAKDVAEKAAAAKQNFLANMSHGIILTVLKKESVLFILMHP
jgi:hypothetical protein